jgi:serine phosphatase RsbU (regulator of sigma subunit)
MKVLLVEDNEGDARLLRSYLAEAAGASVQVESAYRLTEALARLAAEAFDAVLIDLGLPDSQGLDTYRRVAHQAPNAAVVVMSGLEDEVLATSAVQLGAQDYLTKGNITPQSLYKSLRYAAERARRQQAERHLRAADEEVRVAREIQQRLLPRQPLKLPGFDIAGATLFAGKLGGDLFDFVPMRDDRWGVVIADASGHGLGAALLMAQTRAYVRSLSSLALDPCDIVTRANGFMVSDTEDNLFVTLFLLQLDPRTSSFVCVSAGHNGYLFEPGDQVKILRSTGLPLGVDENATFSQTLPATLIPGQVLVLVTDGIPEATAVDNSLFGSKRLIEVVHRNRDCPAQEMVAALLSASNEFSSSNNHRDDQTAIVVKCHPRTLD